MTAITWRAKQLGADAMIVLDPIVRENNAPYRAGTTPGFHAVLKRDGKWWIGWIEEIAGVNSQGKTRAELLANLLSALPEALEFNRQEARAAAGAQ